MKSDTKQLKYWRKNRRITMLLLGIWFVVTFVVTFYARELSGMTLFGFPFSFYMGAQGALIIYALIIGFYAWYMNRLDGQFGADEADD